jgi:ribonuclease P/MRP protein subunit RPP40
MNVDKSEFILIASRQRLATLDNHNLTVNINGNNIKKVDKCKHLGVIIDKHLTWNDNIEYTRKQALKGLHMLKRAKPFLPHDILKTVYSAIVLPHLEYCNIVWGNCGSTIGSRLQIIQNRSARIICGVAWDTPHDEVLNQLKWFPLTHRQVYNCNILTYKIINNMAPT